MINFKRLAFKLFFLYFLFACKDETTKLKNSFNLPQTNISNPIVDGYYADPSIIIENGKFYIYATKDPWGKDDLAFLESSDFKSWKLKKINWPTKEDCTSPTSNGSMVWAPSVVKAKNGNYYMYVSVGSEVWAGVATSPGGPWKNAMDDNTPLITQDLFPDYHMIDAEAFIDDDGQAYLYWGSGLNWMNGRCFVVKLKKDMITFDGEIMDVTPENYFEAPAMIKRNGIYYLMYSDGKVIEDTYKVRYAIGDNPFGPFKEAETSPILSTASDSITYSPGHHTVFSKGGQNYILYHRHSANSPQSTGLLRELCVDSLNFTKDGLIKNVKPSGIASF
ncbi:family 43 glycosylhydrolase [Leeuwenhoekiella palythoae]|uniref:Glycosyl hydrolase family 43 n=1 Tax=Leeuwenhoekiella palythoae TaxID=573501 RepID=A0A1M5ZSE1_9FLAO|nr:family 43 glycosylhydrolase [Leeuwenhoekiella palythoae]RXG26829.1 glycosyl hydrolase family 43 [Leeuwenhoekiella palythoae]SHI26843.1 Glycosyl hydrolases family 43 [Leeuwenhoekiella palythoae]